MKINELTKFAITLFLLPWVPAFILYKHSLLNYAVICICTFVVLSLICFIFKGFAKFFKNIVDKIGKFLGKYIAIVVLTIGYFLAVLPTGLIMKLVKRDRLKIKRQSTGSYWINNENTKTDYEYQF